MSKQVENNLEQFSIYREISKKTRHKRNAHALTTCGMRYITISKACEQPRINEHQN